MRIQWRLFHRHHHRQRHLFIVSPQSTSPFPSLLSSCNSVPQIAVARHYSSNKWRHDPFCVLAWLFTSTDVQRLRERDQLAHRVSILRKKLVKVKGDSIGAYQVLEQIGLPLFSFYYDGSAMVKLLNQLHEFPHLAVKVFNWRRNHAGLRYAIAPEEYAKGIKVAGRAKNVDLAVELFTEAISNGARTSSIYNSLMGVYMLSGMPDKCQSLFCEFKRDGFCSPTVVTYNILISVFARLMLVKHMEATLQAMYNAGLSPTSGTFNNLIAGYITAWMWDRMESTYVSMNVININPDKNTHMLMLRGYAYSGNLEKMEEIYEQGKHHFGKDDVFVIRLMISAYCKNPCANRIDKIGSLIRVIPESEFKPWFNVLLIKVYAEEQALEGMEKYINIAFEQHTAVHSVHVMRSIITAYYHLNAVEKLSSFVKRAESAGWRICRSLYHCKMVMYATQSRLEEMESVLGEMEKFNLFQTRKTWSILCKAYSNQGAKCKLEQVEGLMCKLGYGLPLDDCLS